MTTADNRPRQQNTTGEDLHKVRLYVIWQGMHARCYNPNYPKYKNYGARGITVCEEWNHDNVNGYENFRMWALQNGYREDLTIDRINVNENYEPLNCRWISNKEQQRNRTSNHSVTVNGVQYTSLAEAIESLHREKDYKTIQSRIYQYGYTADEAFNEPIAWNINAEQITIDGKTYRSIRETCRALNLNRNAVKCYKRTHHITWEEAIQHYSIK